jgi:hypothetical protein
MAESLDKKRLKLEAEAYEKHRKAVVRTAGEAAQKDFIGSYYDALNAGVDAEMMLAESKRALKKVRKKGKK